MVYKKQQYYSQFRKVQPTYKDIEKIQDIIYQQLILSSSTTQNK